nr:hypothetical protein [Tanacetum cinerariifolium]
MHKNTKAVGVKKSEGKGPMIRGEGGVPELAKSLKTKIVLKRKPSSKEKSTSKDKPVKGKQVKEKSKKAKETYVDGLDQLHIANLLSAKSERLRLERIEIEQRIIDEEINDDLDDNLEAITSKLSRKERLIQEFSGGPCKGFETRIETWDLKDSLDSDQTCNATRLDIVDEGDEDDASNFTVFVHGKQYDIKEKEMETTTHTTISSSRTPSSQENISCYLNETSAPSLEELACRGLQKNRLLKSQTVDVQEVTMSEPTKPNQSGSTRVDFVLITLDETLTLELPPKGNPELTSLTSVFLHVLRTDKITLTTPLAPTDYCIEQYKQVAPTDSCRAANLKKRFHNDQDDHENYEGEKRRRKKRLAYRGKRATTNVINVYSNLKISFIATVKVDLVYEYGFLESIIVTRADKKKYTFKESDFFGQLNLNEIEDIKGNIKITMLLNISENIYKIFLYFTFAIFGTFVFFDDIVQNLIKSLMDLLNFCSCAA